MDSAGTSASTIRAGGSQVTLINVFDVAPEHQAELIDLLEAGADQTMRRLPGFISATIHRSLDGTKVVNYMHWESTAAFEATFDEPAAQDVRSRIAAVVQGYELTPYQVCSIHESPSRRES